MRSVRKAGGDAHGDVTDDRLRMLTPTAKPWILAALTDNFAAVVGPYGILASQRRLCHFLAQAAHESAGFRTLEEFGGATYWSRYEGRTDLGNTNSGDGVRYHGRGIFQLTGRANYRAMGGKISVGLEDEPHLAAEGDVSLRTACEVLEITTARRPGRQQRHQGSDPPNQRRVQRAGGSPDLFPTRLVDLGRSRSAGRRLTWNVGRLSGRGNWSVKRANRRHSQRGADRRRGQRYHGGSVLNMNSLR